MACLCWSMVWQLVSLQPLNPGLFCLKGGKAEKIFSPGVGRIGALVLSMGSVSSAESHIQMDYMRNLTSCLKTNHSLCSNE